MACKSKKNMASTSPAGPTDAQLAAVTAKIPEATMADLKKGHQIFYGACTNCHAPKDVSGYSAGDLKAIIGTMASKAELSEQDKEAVWRYALGVNLSAKK
jgi:trimethylamine-N-oxide reductase (cytochrome c)